MTPDLYSDQRDVGNCQRTDNYFSIFSVNIRSIRHKICLLEAELTSLHYPEIIAIQESHIDSTVSDDDLVLSDYSIVRNYRTAHGGGVVLFISHRLGWSQPNLAAGNPIEFICVDVFINRKRNRICNVYRPPNSNIQ